MREARSETEEECRLWRARAPVEVALSEDGIIDSRLEDRFRVGPISDDNGTATLPLGILFYTRILGLGIFLLHCSSFTHSLTYLERETS